MPSTGGIKKHNITTKAHYAQAFRSNDQRSSKNVQFLKAKEKMKSSPTIKREGLPFSSITQNSWLVILFLMTDGQKL